MKQRIHLTESQLKEKIGEVIKKVLHEAYMPQNVSSRRQDAYVFLRYHLDDIFNELSDKAINEIIVAAQNAGFQTQEDFEDEKARVSSRRYY